ncbi:MAG TPA: ABC transporter ATP-binding protein [Fimbriimonadaceae bacterium]|nr:ABC transporter ATP-binding protein [Fimbriimonadaceae bacterium]HRJ95706.1 ABC transporter ATP-binding protein [Fimbriimonadaceae bacterium]
MALAIECRDLTIRYRQKSGAFVEAVRDLSFSVKPGEVVGFLGPNGAGKSSTLKALMGFVQPIAGLCRVFGEPAGGVSAKRRIGYLPEVALYYPFLTPLETLTLYGQLQGLRGRQLRSEAHDLLDLLGISHVAGKQNRTLSKGMLQRVGIAQSLLGSPDLLVLDEITSGLDPVGRRELRTLLKSRRDEGTTLFFSSHELAEVEMLCDRILVIHRGRLVEERLVSTLKDQLRRHSITYSGRVSMVGLTDELTEIAPGTVTAVFETKEALLVAIERVQGSGQILDIVSREGSLEDYFVDTIQGAA